MLEGLFGNKNIERVLVFLFVNGTCYGSQLQRAFHVPLTPLQNALERLEEGGILTSHYEGKTRLYQFNPTYPLLNELELLLKKRYTLLSGPEKKEYYVPKEEHTQEFSNLMDQKKVLFVFWEKLMTVRKLIFIAKTKSKEETGWSGRGEGEVFLTKETSDLLIFNEKGTWLTKAGEEVHFSNVFRWTLDRFGGTVGLEHLRRGPEHPVFLFHLAPSGRRSLSSVDSHLCGGDVYFGRISFDRHQLHLNWRVIGPRKNEEIDYTYF